MKNKLIAQLISMGISQEKAESEATCFAAIFEDAIDKEKDKYLLSYTAYTALVKFRDKIEEEFKNG